LGLSAHEVGYDQYQALLYGLHGALLLPQSTAMAKGGGVDGYAQSGELLHLVLIPSAKDAAPVGSYEIPP